MSAAEQITNPPAVLSRLLRNMRVYTRWDTWKTHPLCFLPPEEVQLIELFLRLGSAAGVAEAVGFSLERVRQLMPQLEYKIYLGKADYQRALPLVYKPGGCTLSDVQELMLQRPVHLLSAAFMPEYDWRDWLRPQSEAVPETLGELMATGGIHAAMEALGQPYLPADLCKSFERLGLHHLLVQPTQ